MPTRDVLRLPHDADKLCGLAAHEIDERCGTAGDGDALAVAQVYIGMALVVRLGEVVEAIQEIDM